MDHRLRNCAAKNEFFASLISHVPMPTPHSNDCSPPFPYAVMVGGANMDVAAASDAPFIPADSNVGKIRCAPGGVARNVAENLARLGRHTHLISVVGDDVFGQSVKELTRSSGVNVSAVLCLKGCRTSTYLSLHGPNGDMAVAVNDMGILEQLGPELLVPHETLLAGAAAVVLDTNLNASAIEWLLLRGSRGNGFVDGVSVGKCQKVAPYLAHIQTLKLNALEAQALTGLQVSNADDGRVAALSLHQRGVRRVVISLGAQGVVWCDADAQTGHLPAKGVNVISTSGAGDALLAGIVYGSLANWSFPVSVEFGRRCAEFTLSSPYSNHSGLSVDAV
jgi:pseudouridine kinase